MPAGRPARRWAAWGLSGYAAVLVLVLLTPLSTGSVVRELTTLLHQVFGWESVRPGWVEFGANILLFVPFGLFLALLAVRWWLALVLALTLSVAAETVQAWLPHRVPDLTDIVGNVFGALIGVLLAAVIMRPRS